MPPCPVVPLNLAFLLPIAHRGLHDAHDGRIENTASAFLAAIANSCGIECDLQAAANGLPVVFHDETLDRLIEGTGPIASCTPADLSRLNYRGTKDETILTFADLLQLVAGRTPLLVEVKSAWTKPDPRFLAKIAQLSEGYGGPLALMSFDPAVLASLSRFAPSVPRGLVSGSYGLTSGTDWWPGRLTHERRTSLSKLQDFDTNGASFVAYEVGALPTPATEALRARGIPVLAWTVRSTDGFKRAANFADAPIFEGQRP